MWGFVVQFLAGTRRVSFFKFSEPLWRSTSLLLKGYPITVPEVEAAGEWKWPVSSTCSPSWGSMELCLYSPLPHMLSWLPDNEYNFWLTCHAILLTGKMPIVKLRSAGSCYVTHCVRTWSHLLRILHEQPICVILTHAVFSCRSRKFKYYIALTICSAAICPRTAALHKYSTCVFKLLYNTRDSVYASPQIHCPFTVTWIRNEYNQWRRRT
jgi:hypothetical protein